MKTWLMLGLCVLLCGCGPSREEKERAVREVVAMLDSASEGGAVDWFPIDSKIARVREYYPTESKVVEGVRDLRGCSEALNSISEGFKARSGEGSAAARSERLRFIERYNEIRYSLRVYLP